MSVEERDDAPDSDALAWRELVQSPGWGLAKQLANEMHGPLSQVQQIDKALAAVGRGDRDAAEDTVIQIRARSRAVEQFIASVEERARQASAKERRPRAFAALRRIGG